MRAIFSASSPMRSRSVTVLLIAMIMRRSLAAGCRLTMVWLQSPSMVTSYPLTRGSLLMTRSKSSRFPVANPSIAARICASTRPPICSTCDRRASRSASNCLERCSLWTTAVTPLRSAEAAGDVVFRFLLHRFDENFVGHAELHQLSEIHIGSVVRDTGRLLHVVRHHDDRVVAFQFVHEFLDPAGRYRVQGRRGFVEQQYFGFHRDAAGDAQALLLAAGQAGAALLPLFLDLVPERRLAQGPFNAFLHEPRGQGLIELHAERDVVVDR